MMDQSRLQFTDALFEQMLVQRAGPGRSEERRVGKECRL